MWEERRSQEQHHGPLPSSVTSSTPDRGRRSTTTVIAQLPCRRKLVVSVNPSFKCTRSGRFLESHPIESKHDIISRLKLTMGQHGTERDPTTLAYAILQPAILNGNALLQLTSSQRPYPLASITKYASRAMWRWSWIWRLRSEQLGPLPRVCDNDVTIKARYFHQLRYYPHRVLGRAPPIIPRHLFTTFDTQTSV